MSYKKRKSFLLTYLLSLRILESSKVRTCFFTKIKRFSKHSFEKWGWSLRNFFTGTEMYGMQVWTYLLSLRFFEGSNFRKCRFFTKSTHLGRRSYEKWMSSVLTFAYFNRDAWCARYNFFIE